MDLDWICCAHVSGIRSETSRALCQNMVLCALTVLSVSERIDALEEWIC